MLDLFPHETFALIGFLAAVFGLLLSLVLTGYGYVKHREAPLGWTNMGIMILGTVFSCLCSIFAAELYRAYDLFKIFSILLKG